MTAPALDPLVSMAIALFIVPRTWRLLRAGVDVLLEATPAHLNMAEVERAMASVSGVQSVHELHIWTITSGFVALSGHVAARGRASDEVLHELLRLLRERFSIEHATLQVEAVDHGDEGACCTLDPRCLIPGEPKPTAAVAASDQQVRS
jgi:cobalt-zinc-cadmium efflux system protein